MLILTLTSPHLHERGEYQRTAGRKRFRLSAPKSEFVRSLWPNRGLTWGQAVSICETAQRIRRSGRYEVDCGTFIITANNCITRRN